MRLVIGAILAGSLLTGMAQAGDYKPVRCSAAKPYAGAAQMAPDVTGAFGVPATPDSDLDTVTQQRLIEGLHKAMAATHAGAMTAAVAVPGKGRWQNAVTTDGVATDKLFFWASAGKTLTAIAVLQLVEEGKLSLVDPVSKWINGVPNGDVITVGQVLDHTSGLFSANEDLVFRKSPHRMGLDEEVSILDRHGAMFCPGENWRYSNSGYALLGVILEKVEGKPYDRIVTERVIDKLGLKHMRMVTPDDGLSDVMPLVSQTAEVAIDPRQPGAAGGVVAMAADMVVLWQTLLDGGLLKPETVRGQFRALYPMFSRPQFYGQGVMVYALPVTPGEAPATWVGHSGGAPGVKAVVAYSLKDKAFVAVAMTGDGSAEATAALLLRQLQ